METPEEKIELIGSEAVGKMLVRIMKEGDAHTAKQLAYAAFLSGKPPGPDKDEAIELLQKSGFADPRNSVNPYERETELLGEVVEYATLLHSYKDSVLLLDLLSAYLTTEHPYLIAGIVRHLKASIAEREGNALPE